MKLVLAAIALALVTLFSFCAPIARAQQTQQGTAINMTPEQQDVVNLLQNESMNNLNRARQAELTVSRLQRELDVANKKAAECAPKDTPKK